MPPGTWASASLRTEYIAYLDGDDRWHPRFLERQLGLIESLPPDVGVVFCRSRVMLENGTLLFFQRQRVGSYDYDDLLVASNPARNGSSLLIRTSCFADVGGFDEDIRYVEDLEMWLRIAHGSKTPVLWGSRHYLVDWRLRPGSVTRDRGSNAAALDELLAAHTPRMRRMPAGLAYVRPATAALKYGGDEDLAEDWAEKAKSAGAIRLLRETVGWRLLFWSALPRAGREVVRSVQRGTREFLKSANLRIRGSATSYSQDDGAELGRCSPDLGRRP